MMFDAAAAVVAREAIVGDATAAAPPLFDHAPVDAPSLRLTVEPGPHMVERAAERDTLRFTDSRAPTSEAAPARDVIFIDTSVADYRQLADEWAGRGDVVVIDATRDGIDQIRTALAGRRELGAIHIVSHGTAGVLDIGTTRIDAATISGDLAASLGAIGRSLSADGDILIYGCNFAEGSAGARALAAFADATGADVAASTDTTGYAARGGTGSWKRTPVRSKRAR